MATFAEALQSALQQHLSGNFAAAEEGYQRLLEISPGQPDVLHLYGVLSHQTGRLDQAIDLIGRAIRERPTEFGYHSNLGNALKDMGRFDQAIDCYRRALELKSDDAAVYNNLGLAVAAKGNLGEAIECYRKAIALDPKLPEAHNNLGTALQGVGRIDDAIAAHRQAIDLNPERSEPFNNLGIALQRKGQHSEALENFGRAVQIDPRNAAAWSNAGNSLQSLGRNVDAARSYRKAIEIHPRYPEAHNNLGNALQALGRYTDAIESYRKALAIMPGYPEAHNNLGNMLSELGRRDEACAHLRAASNATPFTATLLALVHELQHLGDWSELLPLSRTVIERSDAADEFSACEAISPFSFLSLPIATTAEQQHRCARRWAWQYTMAPVREESPPGGDRRPKSKLTIGYMSADFHAHPTSFLAVGLFELHDRERFRVHAYSLGPDDQSAMRKRLVAAFDQFVDIGSLSHEEAAQRILADGVDILVDLKGYTGHSRPQIAALRPAPIQVSYLGFPGTMGAEFIDYLVVDDFVVPPVQQEFFTEKLVHLPNCYQINDRGRVLPSDTPSRSSCGLPESGFIFCSFNNTYKITPNIFAVWMRLLQAVPGSVLWLLESNRFAPDNFRREASNRGVEPDRLVFAPALPLPEHLARYRLAELFLDTNPVSAHTTASDALWVGCPLLTYAGNTFASRVAGSLLHSVGLPEFVTGSLEEYESTARRLAQDPDCLRDVRARLIANRLNFPLFDTLRFTRNFEKALQIMWEAHCAGTEPRAFRVEE